ncbi:MAG: ATP-binding protein [Chloroflexota bacterium]|nr:ATP-binding protein [Chloroflexota bacterium]
MKAADKTLIDLPRFIAEQRRERYPSFVVHGRPLSGKSTFARELAKQPNVAYLDVLSTIAENQTLAGQIDQVDASTLQQLILTHAATRPANVLLIDELDFLLYTWTNDLTPFIEMVTRLVNPGKPIVFGFFVQTRPVFDEWSLLTAGRVRRVINFEDIKPL